MFKNTLRNFLQEDFPISFIWNPFLHDFMSFLTSMGLVPELFLETYFQKLHFFKIYAYFYENQANFEIFYKYGVSPVAFFGNIFQKTHFLRFLSILVIFSDFTT